MRKALNVATTIVFILVLVFAFLLVGVRLFGLAPYTVLSGSMEPEYHVGSLIYVKKVSPSELEVDMPITYKMNNGVVVTHRIIDISVDENDPTKVQYFTKGDANEDPDGTPVSYENILGRPVFTVPYLGYVCYFIQNPPGTFIVVGFLILFVFVAFLPDLMGVPGKDKKGRTGRKSSQDDADVDELVAELVELRRELARRSSETDPPPPSDEKSAGDE